MSENTLPPAQNAPPVTAQPQRPAGNGFGIAALVLGIVTMAGFAIPFLNFATIATGIAGIVLGIIGLVVKFKPRKAAVAGVVLSGLGLILSIILVAVYAAAFNGAVNALDGTVSTATSGASSSSEGVVASSSFKNGTLKTSDLTIRITSHKVIPVGQPGNEYGTKPVLAFYYKTTNLTDKKVDPSTAFILNITAFQDNDPDAENQLDVGSTPDDKFLDSQLENIKKGGTVENAVSYELDDLTTPVDLVASEDLGFTDLGKVTYPVK